MPPRNSRLSAYYNLSPTLPKTRDEGLSHAENLTKTLPLTELLTHATNQKHRYENLRKQLDTTTLSHYQHLQSALQTAQQVHQEAEQLKPDTECVNRAISLSRNINEQLSDTRKLVRSLEAVRKVEQLTTAAGILSKEFPKLSDQLPLCTDPQHLHRAIFLASQRYSCIRPAVGKLAAVDKSLQARVETLDNAKDAFCKSLNMEQTVLERGDVARVRTLLSDDAAHIEKDFVRGVVEDVLHRQVSKKALSGTNVENCTRRVEFFAQHVLDDLLKDVGIYEELLGKCLWVDHVVDDALVEARVLSGVLDDIVGVARLRACLKTLSDRGDVGRRGAEGIEESLCSVAVVEAGELIRALLKEVVGLEKLAIVGRANDLRQRVVTVLEWDDARVENLFYRNMSMCDDVSVIAAGAGLCEVLLKDGWSMVRIRDTCVERCVERVLQLFRGELHSGGGGEFVQGVRSVRDIGLRFDVDGLVDDDLGGGLGYRVLGGVVEIVREICLDASQAERIEDIIAQLSDTLDVDTLRTAVEERRFD